MKSQSQPQLNQDQEQVLGQWSMSHPAWCPGDPPRPGAGEGPNTGPDPPKRGDKQDLKFLNLFLPYLLFKNLLTIYILELPESIFLQLLSFGPQN